MKNKPFKIDIFGLKLGKYEFDFEFDDKLFLKYEGSIIEKGKGSCKIELVKKERLLELTFFIVGKAALICDRSNDVFDYTIDIQEQLILKFGEVFDDSEDDIWTIPDGQQSINFEKCLYDYLTLAIPMKKLHPRFDEDEDENELHLVYSSKDEENTDDDSENDEIVDPRWEALKNINKN